MMRRRAVTWAKWRRSGTSTMTTTPRPSSKTGPGTASARSKSARAIRRPWSAGVRVTMTDDTRDDPPRSPRNDKARRDRPAGLIIPSRPASREQPAAQLLLGHLLHPQAQRRHPHRQVAVLGQLAHLAERPQHQLAQLVVDLVLAPHELLDVLHPLEVAHRHAAGVAQD